MEIYLLENPQHLQEHLTKSFIVHELITHWDESGTSEKNRFPVKSAKHLLFYEQVNLFVFDGECFRETLPKSQPFVLFGINSCDLTAIAYQDKLLVNDPYYQARRKQSVLVGIDCITPCKTGFCLPVSAGPGVDIECADLILHRLEKNRWLLIVTNNTGKNAIDGFHLEPANSNTLHEREKQLDECENMFCDVDYLNSAQQIFGISCKH